MNVKFDAIGDQIWYIFKKCSLFSSTFQTKTTLSFIFKIIEKYEHLLIYTYMYVIHKFLDSVVCKANSYVSCCIFMHGLIKSHAPYIISIPQYILYIVPRCYFIWRGMNIKLIITGRIKKEMYLSPIQNTKN